MKGTRAGISMTTAALSLAVVILVAALVVVSESSSAKTTTSTSFSTVTRQQVTTTTEVSTVSANYTEEFTTLVTLTSSVSRLTECVDEGPPGPLELRVLNDSSMVPVIGANVTATNTPIYCRGNGNQPLDDNVTVLFTTGPTEWYSIYGEGPDASFAVNVTYAGQNYSFVADLHAESATCATLFLPSGRTNVTAAGTFDLTCG